MSDSVENDKTGGNKLSETKLAEHKTAEKPKEYETGPIGLDIGTTNIVVARNRAGGSPATMKQLNAFFAIPKSKLTAKILSQNDIMYFARNGQFYIIGNSAEEFANTFNTETRRPIESGLISPREDDGLNVIQALIKSLLQPPKKQGEPVCFSIPGEPIDGNSSVLYHESIIKRALDTMGYSSISINEGFAVVLSELSGENYTGLGVSMGGGMCNVCLSYLSVPVFSFSIRKGGDYIDSMVGKTVGEPATLIKTIKEKEFSLLREPANKIETSLQIYYKELITYLVHSIQQVMASSDRMPRLGKPVPIVLSGGTATSAGVKELFEKSLKGTRLPIQISGVKVASDPLNTTARGALAMAVSEEN
ncbi:MAG: hypothetical protein HQK89_08275 [Nitrospirae bacterium]|nr:hypothetical protein [Nitrospirota bacterium]